MVELAAVDLLDQVGSLAFDQRIQIAAVFAAQFVFHLTGQQVVFRQARAQQAQVGIEFDPGHGLLQQADAFTGQAFTVDVHVLAAQG